MKINKTRYIILGHQRTGTTVTHFFLKNHQQISTLDSEINDIHFYTKGIKAFTNSQHNDNEMRDSYLKLFDTIASLEEGEKKILGFKTALDKVKAAKKIVKTIQKYLYDVKIIIVYRDSCIDVKASMEKSKTTGIWHSWQNDKSSDSIRINKNDYTNFYRNYHAIYEELFKLFDTNDVMIFNYEENILPNKKANYDKILNFLGITDENVDIPLKKISPPAKNYIDNYDEIYQLDVKLKNSSIKNLKPKNSKNKLKRKIVDSIKNLRFKL